MENLKGLLYSHNFVFKKAYGQNFLTDELLLSEIVEKSGAEGKTVLEIGCGAGALTRALSLKAKRVIGYEIDTKLKPVLEETLANCDNVGIVYQDVMKEKVSEIESKLKEDYVIVANLPYYITTPIIMNFLENAKHLISMTIMVQQEVAARFTASPASSDYGAITVGINLRGSAVEVLKVPREKFTPVPNVDSAVVRIDIEKDKFKGENLTHIRDLVRCAFSSRRKMLVNNIMNFYKKDRRSAEEILNKADIKITERGERLSALDFVRLSKVMEEYE